MQNPELIKSIEKIAEAKSVTEAFIERSSSVAQWIGDQMEDLGVKSVLGGKYKLRTVRGNTGSETALYRIIDEDFVVAARLIGKKLSSTRETCHLWGDFNATYQRPCRDDVIQFAKDVPAIIEELASFCAVPDLPEISGERAMQLTIENAPIGTKAPAIMGGHWVRVERGWKWCTGATLQRPGGDWNGQLIPPSS